jgi:membrane glycosyltransferase
MPSPLTPNLTPEPILTDMTPAGLQSTTELAWRRRVVLLANVATYIALLALAASVLGAGGWTIVTWVMFLCFAIGTPWTVLGFWNAVIGLWLLHGGRDARAEVAPYMAAGDVKPSRRVLMQPHTAQTSVTSCSATPTLPTSRLPKKPPSPPGKPLILTPPASCIAAAP